MVYTLVCLGIGYYIGSIESDSNDEDPEFNTLSKSKSSDSTPKSSSRRFIGSRASKTHLVDQYEVDTRNPLGKGGYGKVYRAINKKDKNIKIAVKTVKKSLYNSNDLESLHRELEILSKVDNPNIVKYFENYEDENYIYICQELCEGGDLHQN